MIFITPQISLREDELSFQFVTSPGPGGQNVNKVATAVQLRFNLWASPSFSEEQRLRLMLVLASKLTKQGELLIKASRFRTQERNKQDALDRFVELLRRAATPPKKRRKTKPSKAAVQRRLSSKKITAAKKKLRHSTREED